MASDSFCFILLSSFLFVLLHQKSSPYCLTWFLRCLVKGGGCCWPVDTVPTGWHLWSPVTCHPTTQSRGPTADLDWLTLSLVFRDWSGFHTSMHNTHRCAKTKQNKTKNNFLFWNWTPESSCKLPQTLVSLTWPRPLPPNSLPSKSQAVHWKGRPRCLLRFVPPDGQK